MESFAEALRKARKGAGLSQEQLADAIGVTRTMVGLYESEKRPAIPSRDRVLKIAEALEQSPLDTDRLLAAANYKLEHEVKPGELTGLVQLEEARVKYLVAEHFEVVNSQRSSELNKRHDFYAHISMPPNYIPRTELLEEVRAMVLGENFTIVLTSAIKSRPTALHGMGGIGKSVIARALCDDAAVRAAFPDGILWATLGQTPDLIMQMREWVSVLDGTISESVGTIERVKSNLADLLQARACLLIVDDVWQRSHADAFRVGGNHCRLLMTTRDAEIARELGAQVKPIPTMTKIEAVTLLEEWANGQLSEIGTALKVKIAERLGRLPLAIKLAGAQLQRKQPSIWLETFNIHQLTFRRTETIHDSLETTFNLSVDELDSRVKQMYIALSIFKQDEGIPEFVVCRLWQSLNGLDGEAVAELIDDLADRALLQITQGVATRIIDLHDLLWDFMSVELGEERVRLHQVLLNAYRNMCMSVGWHTADDDGYLYDHLAHHLYGSMEIDELKALFNDQAWMMARVENSMYIYDGYIADIGFIWKHTIDYVQQQIDDNHKPTAFTDCFRLALLRTSLNSVAENYDPVLIKDALTLELWTIDRALSLASRIPDIYRKASMYVSILEANKLDAQRRGEVQKICLKGVIDSNDGTVLLEMVPILLPHLMEHQRNELLEYALNMLMNSDLIITGVIDSKFIVRVANYINGDLLDRMVNKILQDMDDTHIIISMATLLPRLNESLKNKIRQDWLNLEKILEIDPAYGGIEAASALMPYLSEEERSLVLESYLDNALQAGEDFVLPATIESFAPYLKEQSMQIILDNIPVLDVGDAIAILKAIAPYMKDVILRKAINYVMELENPLARFNTLLLLSKNLMGEERENIVDYCKQLVIALYQTRSMVEEQSMDILLNALPYYERIELVKTLLFRSQKIAFDRYQSKALASLTPYLPIDKHQEIWQKCLEVTRDIIEVRVRIKVLMEFVSVLENEQRDAVIDQLFEDAIMLSDLSDRYDISVAKAFAISVPFLKNGRRSEAIKRGIRALEGYFNELGQAEVLAMIAPYTPQVFLEQAVFRAMKYPSPLNRVLTRSVVIPYLNEEVGHKMLQDAFGDAMKRSGYLYARAMMSLIPHLSGEQRNTALENSVSAALEAIRNPTHVDNREEVVEILVYLSTYFPEKQKAQIVQLGLNIATSLNRPGERLRTLALLLPSVENHSLVSQAIHQAILDLLKSAEKWTLQDFLVFCSSKEICNTSILDADALGKIAIHIVEICQDWSWL